MNLTREAEIHNNSVNNEVDESSVHSVDGIMLKNFNGN
jgi:hypothetical protein